jgi:SAM-dependent methyltransferase
MKECSKSIPRRLRDAAFATNYFRGIGIDIGGKPDPLSQYGELFPLVESIKTWDWEDGDAQLMAGVADDTLDFVHSSHCLEHLVDPVQGLRNWLRILRPCGHLIVTVPDEDLYEQGVFPSTFNRDHKWTFTIQKPASWSERSINVFDLLRELGADAEILKVELLHATYRYALPRYDQTLTPIAECGIEIVVRKRHPNEVAARGRLPADNPQPSRESRIHLNQYRDDYASMKRNNIGSPPFGNDDPL